MVPRKTVLQSSGPRLVTGWSEEPSNAALDKFVPEPVGVEYDASFSSLALQHFDSLPEDTGSLLECHPVPSKVFGGNYAS